jgi:transcription elongation factor Elf1
MNRVTKTIKVNGKCRTCGKKNSSEVKATGVKGSTGDWFGKAKCGNCGAAITLTKLNVQF